MTLISLAKTTKYLTNRSIHHTTQCLKVTKSNNAQPAKICMQRVLDTTGNCVHARATTQGLETNCLLKKNQENLGSTQPMRSSHIAQPPIPHMGSLAALLKSLNTACCSGLHTEQSQSCTGLLQPLSQAAPWAHPSSTLRKLHRWRQLSRYQAIQF